MVSHAERGKSQLRPVREWVDDTRRSLLNEPA